MPMTAPSFRIAIIGAGPAGCTLAQLLLAQGSTSEVTIFELDADSNARSQGGTLDLRSESGLLALRQAKLYDEFLKYARYDGEAFKITDEKLLAYIWASGSTGEKSGKYDRPEIDRYALRRILLQGLPENTIRWGSHLRSVKPSKNVGKYDLHFDHGTASGFDLVVGADGAWSKVRGSLTDVKPHFSGVAGYSMLIPDAASRHPDLYKLINRGSVFAHSYGKSIMGQQLGDGSLNVYVFMTKDSDAWAKNSYGPGHETERHAELDREFDAWDPQLRKLYTVADDSSVVARSLYMLPVGFGWSHKRGLTVIGDAAHLQTPFAGAGVNLAMEDSLYLANAILAAEKAGGESALDEEIEAFERDMFARAKKVTAITEGNLVDLFFTPGAPRSVVAKVAARMAGSELAGIQLRLVQKLIYVFYAVFKLIW